MIKDNELVKVDEGVFEIRDKEFTIVIKRENIANRDINDLYRDITELINERHCH